MVTKSIIVGINPGPEEHPAALFVQVANQFESSIHIRTGNKKINAKSIMGVMTLKLDNGEKMEIIADGTDESKAVAKIEEFLKAN